MVLASALPCFDLQEEGEFLRGKRKWDQQRRVARQGNSIELLSMNAINDKMIDTTKGSTETKNKTRFV